jgi:hypothetical protein
MFRRDFMQRSEYTALEQEECGLHSVLVPKYCPKSNRKIRQSFTFQILVGIN